MILQEADFLKVNLKTMSNTGGNASAASAEQNKPDSAEAAMPTNQEDAATHKAWGDLLTSRLAENRRLSGEAKKPDQVITKAFFEEYFKSVWGDNVGSLLVAFGDLLRNDIQKLGFDRNKNPLLAFISQRYVSENLIATKHLNASTYAVLHNAIAKKLVAHSEFRGKRNYNIIYCRSFYNHRPADMLAYLQLQLKNLSLSASSYTLEMQKKNRQIFLLSPKNNGATVEDKAKIQARLDLKQLPHTLNPQTKLAKLEVAQAVRKLLGMPDVDEDEEAPVATKDDISKLASELKEPADQLALMQYLFIQTGSDEAKKFIAQDKFSSISAGSLVNATARVRARVKSMKITKDSVKQLIAALGARS